MIITDLSNIRTIKRLSKLSKKRSITTVWLKMRNISPKSTSRLGGPSLNPNLAFSVQPPRIIDNKKETNFQQSVARFETYFDLIDVPARNRTALLLLNLSSEISYTAKCLGIASDSHYEEPCRCLIAHFTPVETVGEARAQFQTRLQDGNELVSRIR